MRVQKNPTAKYHVIYVYHILVTMTQARGCQRTMGCITSFYVEYDPLFIRINDSTPFP